MKYEINEKQLTVYGVEDFDLEASCECGQSFRWRKLDGKIHGIVGDKSVTVALDSGKLTVTPCGQDDAAFWIKYFDLERNYNEIQELIRNDSMLSVCLPYALGIHVFNQDPFEALMSFIVSSNNNIKRIVGIIDRLCMLAGEPLACHESCYAFPAAKSIAELPLESLYGIGLGYRAPYIKHSAEIIANGYDLEALRTMPLYEARKELCTFPGVGPKVADCVLLFSLGHTNAFPIDVWIDRAMKALYFDSDVSVTKQQVYKAAEALGKYSGIIQQYIFHYARLSKLGASDKSKNN